MSHIMLVLAFVMNASALAAECPQSSPEFMRYLGRSLLRADRLALSGSPEKTAPEDFMQAIAGIEGAIECARPTLIDCQSQLLPERLRGEHANSYQLLMQNFVDLLSDYKSAFAVQMRLHPEERNFTSIRELKQEIFTVVSRSHSGL